MIGSGVLILQLDVFHRSVVARDNFRYRVRKIRRAAGAEITFDDGQFAVRRRDDEVARMDGFAA